jgi:hypothetical protein
VVILAKVEAGERQAGYREYLVAVDEILPLALALVGGAAVPARP